MGLQKHGKSSSFIRDAADRIGLARFGVVTVLVVAIGVRALWVAYSCANGAIFIGGHPFGNGEMGRIALNLAENRGFSSPFGIGSEPTAWECPVVPFIYSWAMKLGGGPNARAATLLFYLQSLIGGLGVWVYWLIVRRLVAQHAWRFAPWLSPAGAVLVCFWPESMVLATSLWYYVWQEAFLALFLFSLLTWRERATPRSAAIAGFCGGVLALINVTPLPIVVILIGLVGFDLRELGYKSAWISVTAFVVVLAPWVVRNCTVFDTLVPLRSNAGFEIFQGNNAIECIREPANAPHPASDPVQYGLYEQMGEIQYSKFCFGHAVSYVRAHLQQTAYRVCARVYIVWMTDLSDHWAPSYIVPWWRSSPRYMVRFLVSSAFVVIGAVGFWWGIVRGRFTSLPNASAFAVVLLFLPFPHYLTLADPEYTTTFRMLVALTSLCMLGLKSSAHETGQRKCDVL